MKRGNQFNLLINLKFKNSQELIAPALVEHIVFTIGDIVKYYNLNSEEVTYDEEKQKYKIRLTQEETLNFDKEIKVEARIKFANNDVYGSVIKKYLVQDVLNEEII